jgi:hypothetical protein
MSGESTEAEISDPKFRMRLRPDGIVQIVWGPRFAMDLEDAVTVLDGITKLTGAMPCPLLVDLRDAGPIDRSARVEMARRSDVLSAVALIVGTPLSRMMGNFYVNVNKPKAPTRLFDDEASAIAWLRKFVA